MIGRIYKLINLNNDDIYIGSTIQTIERRLIQHKSECKRYYDENNNSKIAYISSFDIIKDGNYIIELIEEVEFDNRTELLIKERYYIENNKCINKSIPGRTREEYNREYNKKYREKNKEYFINYGKKYREQNKKL